MSFGTTALTETRNYGNWFPIPHHLHREDRASVRWVPIHKAGIKDRASKVSKVGIKGSNNQDGTKDSNNQDGTRVSRDGITKVSSPVGTKVNNLDGIKVSRDGITKANNQEVLFPIS